ncbi:Pycsar system effector family protein [Salinarimonas soli]|uniref:Pycsar effector protein domain-containing protein n=1 Tax=Salinarimonas soli TaxID=1638099 RepID=A0A5B2VHK8_9HYPH|nr:Pycsar system effector family protein [Salinarimonas soli]KAA2238026.1 hypothetical protein F0L46_07075 [Salinarimonas soli]
MFHEPIVPLSTTSIERAEKSLQRMLEWIGRHDLRSGATMGITVAMLGALSAATPPISKWTASFTVALVLTGLGFAIVVGEIIHGLFPRMRNDRPSMFFFGSIAAMPQEEYRRRFSALTDEDYLQDVLGQVYLNARILRSKFRSLRRAIMALMFTVPAWACALSLGRSLS